MPKVCEICRKEKAVLKRPKTFEVLCKACFYRSFEDEVHHTIVTQNVFKAGEKVAIGASGGKDSTVLAHIMTLLNKRHGYGLDLFLLSIDEGIKGYRDDSLETVKRNEIQYQIPLKVCSYKDLYGWTMDEIVKQIGTKNNCTFCGVFRRQALDRGAMMMNASKVATGHNADDMAETVLLNIIRGDTPRLGRCANIITGEDSPLPRVKPFKYSYEKEIVMYAYYQNLDYFSTECVYAPFAARGFAREYIKELESVRPAAILDLLTSAEKIEFNDQAVECAPQMSKCVKCKYITSQPLCKACVLLDGLNSGNPNQGIRRSATTRASKRFKEVKLQNQNQSDPDKLSKNYITSQGLLQDNDLQNLCNNVQPQDSNFQNNVTVPNSQNQIDTQDIRNLNQNTYCDLNCQNGQCQQNGQGLENKIINQNTNHKQSQDQLQNQILNEA